MAVVFFAMLSPFRFRILIKGLSMLFTRSRLLACTVATALALSACSKENSAQKQDTLKRSARNR
jgi:hypothetical protein